MPVAAFYLYANRKASASAHFDHQEYGMKTSHFDLLANFDVKMTIVDALAQLMHKTSIDELSVDRICAEANISRATFYRYFKDKFDIGKWHVMYCWSLGTDKIGRTLSWREGYYITEAAIAERYDFYVNVAKSKDDKSLDNFAPRMRRDTLTETVVDYRHATLTERLKVQIDAVSRMETYLLPHWHYGAYDMPLDAICDLLASMVPKELFDLLNTPIKSQLSMAQRAHQARHGQ